MIAAKPAPLGRVSTATSTGFLPFAPRPLCQYAYHRHKCHQVLSDPEVDRYCHDGPLQYGSFSSIFLAVNQETPICLASVKAETPPLSEAVR